MIEGLQHKKKEPLRSAAATLASSVHAAAFKIAPSAAIIAAPPTVYTPKASQLQLNLAEASWPSCSRSSSSTETCQSPNAKYAQLQLTQSQEEAGQTEAQ